MIVKEINSDIWSGLSPQYYPDDDLQLDQQKVYYDNGTNFVFSNLLSRSFDQKNNNYSSFVLTSAINFYENFSLSLPESFTNGFVTTFSSGINSINDSQRYWRIVPTGSNSYLEINANEFLDLSNNNIFFELDFLNDNTCRISRKYSEIKYFLNYNFILNKVIFLSGSENVDSEESLYKQILMMNLIVLVYLLFLESFCLLL